MKVTEVVNTSIGLSQAPAADVNYGVAMLLVDHEDIPIDKRYRITTRSGYATELTASTDHLSWCTTLWSQNYNPSQAYLGRWVSSASSPYIVFSSPETTLATWQALTTGYLKITDNAGTPNTDEIGPLNFSSVTSMADVCTVIETALQAIGAPNITGLDTATCELDTYSRIIIKNSTTGASAATISTTTASTGTDIATSTYLGGTGFSQAGLDAEALGTAMSAILELDNTPFVMCERGANISQQVAFSTAVNAVDKILLLRITDTDAKDSSSTTDAAYQIEALSHQKTHLSYTEHSTQNPDAALCGEVMPQAEGSVSFAITPLSGLSESGLGADGSTVIPLTATERAALDAKGCDYLVNPAGSVHFVNGLAAGGNEMRLMIWKSYMAYSFSYDVYAYMLANNVVTYSDADIQAIKSFNVYWHDIGVDRKCIDGGTEEYNYPAASTFTSAQKATHTMTLSDVYSADVQSSVNDMTITMNLLI